MQPGAGTLGPNDPVERAPSVRALPLEPFEAHDPAPADPTPAADPTVARFSVGTELDPTWTVDSARARVEPLDRRPGSPPVLRLDWPADGRQQRVVVPLGEGARRFNHVRVLVQQDRSQRLALRLHLADGTTIETRTRTVIGDREPASVEFDLARAMGVPAEPVALEVRFPWCNARPGLLGVQLERQSLRSFLPDAREGARSVELDGEARPAVGLLEDRPLRARWVARAGEVLELAAGRPRHVGASPGRVRVRLRALPPDGGPPEELEDRRLNLVGSTWRSLRLDLDAQAGRTLELVLALDHPAESRGLCAVATPLLLRRVAAPRRVVLVTSDTHRADHLGLAPGSVDVRTPGLDAFARRGVLFLDARAPTNITNPSHGALMTGLPVRDTGVTDNLTPLAPRARTLAEAFAERGFLTLAATSADHLRPRHSGLGQGFARSACTVRADRPVEETLGLLRETLEQYPGLDTFVWLHVFDVHGPYTPDEADTRRYYGAGDPRDTALAPLPEVQRAPWDPEVRDVEWIRAAYRGEVTALDRVLGPFLADPALADAWVAVTSDHGEGLGEQRIWWEHSGLYPATLDVPLILVGPGVPAGEQRATPVTNTDLGRTLLDLAGFADADFPGRNLLAARDGERARFALSSHRHSASVQRGNHYLVLHLSPHEHPLRGTAYARHQVELFDVGVDPVCAVDRVDAEPARARALRAELVAWLEAAGPGLASDEVDHDAGALEALAALGYSTVSGASDGPLWGEDERACGCAWCARWR